MGNFLSVNTYEDQYLGDGDTPHLQQTASSVVILQLQRCDICRILDQTWRLFWWLYFLWGFSTWGLHLYRNQLGCWRKIFWFCSSESHLLPPSQEEQDSPGSQNQLKNMTIFNFSWNHVDIITKYHCLTANIQVTLMLMMFLLSPPSSHQYFPESSR